MQDNAPVIETRHLTKSFGDVSALTDLNLSVPRHSIFGFLGPNGAGKTTTMKLLLGLLQPTGGSATIFGQDVARDGLAIRARIGYLPQQPRFYPDMTARELLAFTASFFYSGPPTAVADRIAEMLNLVGLEAKADRPIKGFSGGERQRLGLAQAQINYPDLLILDEPAAALDPIGRADVLRIMEKLRKYCTIFYSTHILDDVQQVSDTVAILNHGELIMQGPIELLLRGGGGTVYSVAFRGDADAALARVSGQPWVTHIDSGHQNGVTAWQVSVDDEQAAEERLLRLLLEDEQASVVAFGRKRYELEEVFMALVEDDNHGR